MAVNRREVVVKREPIVQKEELPEEDLLSHDEFVAGEYMAAHDIPIDRSEKTNKECLTLYFVNQLVRIDTKKAWEAQRDAALLELSARGMTQTAIGEVLGYSQPNVSQLLRTAKHDRIEGIVVRNPGMTPEKLAEKIADELDISPAQARMHMKAYATKKAQASAPKQEKIKVDWTDAQSVANYLEYNASVDVLSSLRNKLDEFLEIRAAKAV